MISFGIPIGLLSLLTLIPVTMALAHSFTRRRYADDLLGATNRVLNDRSSWRPWMQSISFLASILLITLALGRPQWGTSEQRLNRIGIDVAIALDVSRSMTATDVYPSRATAAANGLGNMINHMRGDRVGLVTFAGSAFMRSPLTLDLEIISYLIEQSQGESTLVRPGTNINRALHASIDMLSIDDPADTQVIVLVSDGEDLAQQDIDSAIIRARTGGIRVYTVSVGTPSGIDIPTNDIGGTQTTRLNRDLLVKLADETGGYESDAPSVAGLAVEFAHLRQSQFAITEQTSPVDRFQWFLAGAVILLLFHSMVSDGVGPIRIRIRPSSLGVTSIPILSLAVLLLVACGGSESYRHVRAGNDAYDDQSYERALDLYRLASELELSNPAIMYDIGNTLHHLRRFEEAMSASEIVAATTEEPVLLRSATYAIGSHAFRRDAFEDAREAFIRVLLSDPNDDDARHNLELVLLELNRSGEIKSEQTKRTTDTTDTKPDIDAANAGANNPNDYQGNQYPPDDTRSYDTMPLKLDQALESLEDALGNFYEDLTLDEALQILDLVRRINVIASSTQTVDASGALPPR